MKNKNLKKLIEFLLGFNKEIYASILMNIYCNEIDDEEFITHFIEDVISDIFSNGTTKYAFDLTGESFTISAID